MFREPDGNESLSHEELARPLKLKLFSRPNRNFFFPLLGLHFVTDMQNVLWRVARDLPRLQRASEVIQEWGEKEEQEITGWWVFFSFSRLNTFHISHITFSSHCDIMQRNEIMSRREICLLFRRCFLALLSTWMLGWVEERRGRTERDGWSSERSIHFSDLYSNDTGVKTASSEKLTAPGNTSQSRLL